MKTKRGALRRYNATGKLTQDGDLYHVGSGR
jgi:hypothetical protein